MGGPYQSKMRVCLGRIVGIGLQLSLAPLGSNYIFLHNVPIKRELLALQYSRGA